jgi:hypothetical protein
MNEEARRVGSVSVVGNIAGNEQEDFGSASNLKHKRPESGIMFYLFMKIYSND